MNLVNILLVFLGSGIGGVCRYIISRLIQERVVLSAFPWGTFVVNGLGCLLIGIFFGLSYRFPPAGPGTPDMRLFLTVGFCGGFTTFSTFINDNYLLLQTSHFAVMLAYCALSIIGGFLLLFAGYYLVK